MILSSLSEEIYKNFLKPIYFRQDAEKVHNTITKYGKFLGTNPISAPIVQSFLTYKNLMLNTSIAGMELSNPVGLAAGFDYDGHLAKTMKLVGFGYNTIGTVTAKPYAGNPPPRLERLPQSQSLLVNKGFKSEGADQVSNRLDNFSFNNEIIGISVGSSNLPQINTISLAIEDYLYTFEKFKTKSYVKYFELNISCPNTAMTEGFSQRNHFETLVKELKNLKIKTPIFVKMANEIPLNKADRLTRIGIDHGISGFIYSNLVKDRANIKLNKEEIKNLSNHKGNFSGKPTSDNASRLIQHIYREYGKDTYIIGCGGIFSAEDAYEKIKLGATAVQLITGMVYKGPQLIGQINNGLVHLLQNDGFSNITQAVGSSNP